MTCRDEDGAERPRLTRAVNVMDRRSRPGSEPTTLEAVGDQWRYAFVVVMEMMMMMMRGVPLGIL